MLSFRVSSRGKYCPRFLLRYQVEANTARAFFYTIKQRQILAEHSAFLHPLNLVGELLLDVDLGICLLEVFLSKPKQIMAANKVFFEIVQLCNKTERFVAKLCCTLLYC